MERFVGRNRIITSRNRSAIAEKSSRWTSVLLKRHNVAILHHFQIFYVQTVI